LPEDSRQAIRSRGESAIDKVLDEEEPPTLIVVSSAGVRRA
jgi:broad specificity phosphatase PhoE